METTQKQKNFTKIIEEEEFNVEEEQANMPNLIFKDQTPIPEANI